MNATNQDVQKPDVQKPVIKITKDSLPACCPPKDEEHWNQHPRVYLELEQSGEADCPYCGNHFELQDE